MDFNSAKIALEKVFNPNNIKYNEPMKNHTSFRVGGPCDILILPQSFEDISKAIKVFLEYKIPYFIMGNGTNLIVKDGGFTGGIIKLVKLNKIETEGNIIRAECGANLSCTAVEALKHNLKGLEFASGIPGTVGGAVAMNAGAYGPEIKDVIDSAKLMDARGNIYDLKNDKLELSYRNSIVQKKKLIALEASFKLEEGSYEAIKARMDELNKRRADKQPLNYPSAGSTFKRPDGYYAGKLIEDAGLKGTAIGGAMVSEKHAGFIINYNNANANDIINLIKFVQKRIWEEFKVQLDPEVKIIGED
jgi:UDP-N-acetylmuramate dehydrogenase